MKKIIIIIALLLAVLVLVGCGKQEELLTIGETTQSYTQSYIIDGNKNASQQLYGTVMIEDIQNIMTSIGGTLSFLNCQEGKKVTADTLIAKITPNEENATIQNLRLQQELLETQLKNLKETYNMTEENFEIQKESLRAQTEHTQDIYDQNSPDLENLKNSIKNFKAQQETNINDALKKVREN
ncbi:hypothetical protein KKG31_07300 [Patescibacteria group bacterium]|nr:hypothetical protein [Patescibacteria group bacterium]MBU1758883.1 hypothetical protein [Patescibacteria group bacterium]